MRVNNIYFLIVTLILSLTSCDSSYTNLSNGFEVGYVNMKRNRNIYYLSQGIFSNEYTFSVGKDDNYIYVKNHPLDSLNNIMDETLYYIIDINKYKDHPYQMESNGLLGPFDKVKFKNATDSLKIDEVKFSYNY